jgi:hypothetical protein
VQQLLCHLLRLFQCQVSPCILFALHFNYICYCAIFCGYCLSEL